MGTHWQAFFIILGLSCSSVSERDNLPGWPWSAWISSCPWGQWCCCSCDFHVDKTQCRSSGCMASKTHQHTHNIQREIICFQFNLLQAIRKATYSYQLFNTLKLNIFMETCSFGCLLDISHFYTIHFNFLPSNETTINFLWGLSSHDTYFQVLYHISECHPYLGPCN